MGRTGAVILGAALAMAIYATPASAQVSVAVGVGAPRWGASVIVGGPPVYVVDPYYPYAVPYSYYEPYYYYPYAVPYGRVYYRSRPYYYRGGPAYYYRAPSRVYRGAPSRIYRPAVRAGARVTPGRAGYAAPGRRR